MDSYSPELMDSYKDNLDTRCSSGEICREYHRFQLRVMRMLSSLAERGIVDFSSTKSHPLKYIVSNETNNLVEMILDSYPVSPATKNDLRAPTRHFLWYAEQIGIKPQFIDDTIVMSFLIDEVPASNGGSTGRTLRCVKYATEYLRAHGNDCLHRDYTLLKLKNDHRRIIPAYSEEEISGIAQAADTDSTIGKRDLAIILVAYCTGLRGIDIIGIKLSDIDWHNHKVSVVQSKTHTPIVSELNGATLNALADYILDWRPKCDIPEVFVTVKAPYRRLSKGFGSIIDKYCEKASVIACVLYFPMLIFSGTTLPYEVMPNVMQKVISIFPMTQGIQLMKAAFLGVSVNNIRISIVVMVTFVCTGIAVKCFKWE